MSQIDIYEYVDAVVTACCGDDPWPFQYDDQCFNPADVRRVASAGYRIASVRRMAEIFPDAVVLDVQHRCGATYAVRCLLAGIPRQFIEHNHHHRRRGAWVPLGAKGIRRFGRVATGNQNVGRWGCLIPQHIARTSTATLAIFGRMPRYLVEAARMDAARRGVRYITPVDVDWDFVRSVRDHVARSPRARWAWTTSSKDHAAQCAAAMDVPASPRAVVRWLAPEYPEISYQVAVALRRGFSPVDLAAMGGVVVTPAEAHDWLMHGGPPPHNWFVHRVAAELGIKTAVHGVAVARWLRAVRDRGDWDAMMREPPRRVIPEGGYCYADMVDEITPQDLARGPATSVRAAFDSSWRRREAATGHDDPTPLAEAPRWSLPSGVRPLLSQRDLSEEGRVMRHCVAGYADAVRDGGSVVLAVDSGTARSTVEITPDGTVLQHRGPMNRTPDPSCTALVDELIAGIRTGEKGMP